MNTSFIPEQHDPADFYMLEAYIEGKINENIH